MATSTASNTITVKIHDHVKNTKVDVTVNVSGGAGLNQVQDSMKAVSETTTCNSTEGAWTVCAANEGSHS